MALTAAAQKSLLASALAGLANATAALHNAAPRISFFMGPLVLKITNDSAEPIARRVPGSFNISPVDVDQNSQA
jgi:hypothetical protein